MGAERLTPPRLCQVLTAAATSAPTLLPSVFYAHQVSIQLILQGKQKKEEGKEPWSSEDETLP